MGKTLGGSIFVYNGIKQDYCFIEALECLHALCDQVAICYGGDDGTIEAIDTWVSGKKNIFTRVFNEGLWNSQ